MSDIEPSKLKVTELREELKSRGLDTKGTKAVLVKRLVKALKVESRENAEEDLDTSANTTAENVGDDSIVSTEAEPSSEAGPTDPEPAAAESDDAEPANAEPTDAKNEAVVSVEPTDAKNEAVESVADEPIEAKNEAVESIADEPIDAKNEDVESVADEPTDAKNEAVESVADSESVEPKTEAPASQVVSEEKMEIDANPSADRNTESIPDTETPVEKPEPETEEIVQEKESEDIADKPEDKIEESEPVVKDEPVDEQKTAEDPPKDASEPVKDSGDTESNIKDEQTEQNGTEAEPIEPDEGVEQGPEENMVEIESQKDEKKDDRYKKHSRSRSPSTKKRSRSKSPRERRKRSRSPQQNRSRGRYDDPPQQAENDDWLSLKTTTLDKYNSDLNLKIEDDGYKAVPFCNDGFGFMWGGARATYGVNKGKAYFEVKIVEHLDVSHLPSEETNCHVVRVGWSLGNTSIQLGEEAFSYGYGGTGKASVNCKFTSYGQIFGEGDVVGSFVDFDADPVTISFSLNGTNLGICFKIQEGLNEQALFPHVLSKNSTFEVNFGQKEAPWFAQPEGYKFVDDYPEEERIRGSLPPEKKEDCEMLMMCGLPGCGKTTWAEKHLQAHPEKQYYILGTNNIIDKMRVMGLPRKRNYSGRWDVLIDKSTKCLNRLFGIASGRKRNYILDQTNVYPSAQRRKMRPFEGFQRKAIVIVPTDEEYKHRVEKREKEEGKDVPDSAVLQMKGNLQLPEVGQSFDSIDFIELQREEAEQVVHKYNEEGEAARPPPEKRPRSSSERHSSSSKDSGGGGGYYIGSRGGSGGGGGSGRWSDRDNYNKGGYNKGGYDRDRGYSNSGGRDRDYDRGYDRRRGGSPGRSSGGGSGGYRDRSYGRDDRNHGRSYTDSKGQWGSSGSGNSSVSTWNQGHKTQDWRSQGSNWPSHSAQSSSTTSTSSSQWPSQQQGSGQWGNQWGGQWGQQGWYGQQATAAAAAAQSNQSNYYGNYNMGQYNQWYGQQTPQQQQQYQQWYYSQQQQQK